MSLPGQINVSNKTIKTFLENATAGTCVMSPLRGTAQAQENKLMGRGRERKELVPDDLNRTLNV